MKANKFFRIILIIGSLIFAFCTKTSNANKSLKGSLSQKGDTVFIKSKIKLQFEIDNNNINKFGFEEVEGDAPTIPSCITMDSSFIFISDNFHANIKRISKNGEILSSRTNSLLYNSIEITCFNNRVYVFTYWQDVLIFDYELNLIDSLKFIIGAKEIFFQNDELIQVLCGDCKIKEIGNGIYSFKVYNITNQNKIVIDTAKIEGWELEYYKSSGKTYIIDKKGNEHYIKTPFGIIILNENPRNSMGAYKNIAFENNKFAFFDIKDTQLVLWIYEW